MSQETGPLPASGVSCGCSGCSRSRYRLLRSLEVDPGEAGQKLFRRERTRNENWWLVRLAQMFLFVTAGVALAAAGLSASYGRTLVWLGVGVSVSTSIGLGVALGIILNMTVGVSTGLAGVATGVVGVVVAIAPDGVVAIRKGGVVAVSVAAVLIGGLANVVAGGVTDGGLVAGLVAWAVSWQYLTAFRVFQSTYWR